MSIIDLFRPKYKHSNAEIRMKSVENLNDQKLLVKIATEDENIGVKKRAINKLVDQKILFKIATESENNDLRKTAINKITDQEILFKIAMEGENNDLKKTAINRITDQEILFKIAMQNTNIDVRKYAIHNMLNIYLMQKITNECDSNIIKKEIEQRKDNLRQFDTFILKGIALITQGESEEAIKYFDQAIDINQHKDTPWFQKARAMKFIGMPKSDIFFCIDTAVQINPNNAKALYLKGTILYEHSKFEEAIRFYDYVLKIEPNNTATLASKSDALYKLGRNKEASLCKAQARNSLSMDDIFSMFDRGARF